jgi:hypothetical protein
MTTNPALQKIFKGKEENKHSHERMRTIKYQEISR